MYLKELAFQHFRTISGMVSISFGVFLACIASCFAVRIDDESYSIGRFKELDDCSENKGLDWIISNRDADYGWGPHTHRCITAVFTAIYENKTKISHVDQELMILQLQVELSLTLLRSNLNLPQSELAFYIHALVIVGLNPMNFRGVNLVKILEKKIDEMVKVHPFSVLCLCNVGVKKMHYLDRIRKHLLTKVSGNETNFDIEMSAVTLQAYRCSAGHLENPEIMSSAAVLAKLQKSDGSFGNIFTTSVIVQALKSIELYSKQVKKARAFLAGQELADFVDIYYVEMALRHFVFIKDYYYYIDPSEDLKDWKNKVFVMYTIKIGTLPDAYVQLSLKVPEGYTFFDVMKVAEKENPAFKFSNSLEKERPVIYSIGGVPNNAEDGLYWRLYKRISNDIDKSSRLEELTRPVSDFPVRQNEDYIFHYKNIFEEAHL